MPEADEPQIAAQPARPADPSKPPKAPKAPRGRRTLVALLVVVGCVLTPIAVTGVWLKTTLLDTGRYVSTVGPLADNPSVQEAIAHRVTTVLTTKVPVEQEIASRLPDRAQFLAPKIQDALAAFVYDRALDVVQSPTFSSLWKNANERAHERVVNLLEGKSKRPNISTKNGEITLDLGGIIEAVNAKLESRGVKVFSSVAEASSDKQIVLVQSIWLERAQTWTDLLQKLAFVLPLLVLVCFAGAIWLSPNRRRSVLRGALGIALGTGLVLVAINGGRHFYLSALPSTVNAKAAAAVYDQIIGGLRLALRTAFVFGLVAALAAWVSGPARSATRAREGVRQLVRGKGAEGGPVTPTAEFVARHAAVLRGVVIGIGLAILVALSSPTPAAVIVVAVLVLLGVLLVEFLSRRAPGSADVPAPTPESGSGSAPG